MSAVKTSPVLDPTTFLARFNDAAQRAGFRRHPLLPAGSGGTPLAAFTRRSRGVRPRIYLSAGIHGDEPAGPEALLQLLERGVFDDRSNWFIVPLLNPKGFLRNIRENAHGIDLNRDYRNPQTEEVRQHVRWLEQQPAFDLALCLHEDWEATGFYLYELNPEERPSLTPAMLEAAQQRLPLDQASEIDGRPTAGPGLIRPDHDPRLRDQWAEAIYLRAHHCPLVYTLETPSSRRFSERVETLAAASIAGIGAVGSA